MGCRTAVLYALGVVTLTAVLGLTLNHAFYPL